MRAFGEQRANAGRSLTKYTVMTYRCEVSVLRERRVVYEGT